MGSLLELYGTLRSIEITVPASEMMLMMAILTSCLALRFAKTGLMVAYLGTFHWAWMVFQQEFSETNPVFLYSYFSLGVAVVILTMLTWAFAEE